MTIIGFDPIRGDGRSGDAGSGGGDDERTPPETPVTIRPQRLFHEDNGKWAGACHARVIFLRPGYQIHGGTLYGPGGWSQTLTGGAGFSEYARKDLMDHEEQIV